MKYLILIALLASPLAHADKLYLGAKSYHLFSDENEYYRSNHALIAYERNGVIGGYFQNSHDDDTLFIAKRYYHHFSQQTTGSIMVGATFGYRGRCFGWSANRERRVCPMIALGVEHRFDIGKINPLANLMNLGNAIATLPGIEW